MAAATALTSVGKSVAALRAAAAPAALLAGPSGSNHSSALRGRMRCRQVASPRGRQLYAPQPDRLADVAQAGSGRLPASSPASHATTGVASSTPLADTDVAIWSNHRRRDQPDR